jgi:HAD superfamily hydrolase (TIGR01493 family)
MTTDTPAVVSWDLDGTLYDLDALRTMVRQRIVRSVRPSLWRAARDAGRALHLHRQNEQRVRGAGGVVDARARAFWEGPLWMAFHADFLCPALRQLGPHPEALSRMAQLAGMGVRQVVVSDYAVVDKLAALGLTGRFERCFAGTDLGALKPHPSVFEQVLAQLDVPADQVLHVGDRDDTDGLAAQGAGIRFAHVVQGDYEPVDDFLRSWRRLG